MHKSAVRLIPWASSGMGLGVTLLLCLLGHLWLRAALGLSVDEAHYALYAAHPALSYFDHPPLVGWVQIPFVWLGGFDWMMRVVPLALWSITALALWRFSGWALTLFLLSPIHHLLGLALVPDTLLLPITLWVMVLTWKLSTEPDAMRLWLWLGVALGLAGLSKYTAVLLALSSGGILLHTHGVSLLRQRGLWWAVLIAAAAITPVIVWNAQHDWVSFTYQLGHANGNQSWRLLNVLRFDALQLLSYGTLPLIGLVIFLWKLQAQHQRLMWLCLAFGLPVFLLAAYSSGKGAALPHWTATAWLALLPLSGLGLQLIWKNARATGRTVLSSLAVLQALLCLLLVAGMLTSGALFAGAGILDAKNLQKGNPFADLHDWSGAAKQAKALQTEHHASALAVSNWTLASRLAWYARPSKVLALDGKNKQFEMWFGNLAYGQHYIWVDWSQMPMQHPVGCKKLDANSHVGRHSSFDFYLCGRP